jgi:hypothetical protein
MAAVIVVAGTIAIRSAKQADATPEHRAELVNAFLRVLTGEAGTTREPGDSSRTTLDEGYSSCPSSTRRRS